MATKWEAVSKSAVSLLDCPDGAFDFPNMAVSCHDIEMDGSKVGLDTGKLMVTVDVGDIETPKGIEVDDAAKLF